VSNTMTKALAYCIPRIFL